MKVALSTIIVLTILVYPFAVYFGIQHFSPMFFACILILVALARFCLLTNEKTLSAQLIFALTVLYSGSIYLFDSENLLLLYPAFISLIMCMLFGASLRQKYTIIERMAIAAGTSITPNITKYTWRLTAIWSGILLANTCLSVYLALYSSREAWAVYTGFVCYVIFGGIFLVEYVYRQYFISKYGP